MYRVFLGAPTLSDLDEDPRDFQWRTISNSNSSGNPTPTPSAPKPGSGLKATLSASLHEGGSIPGLGERDASVTDDTSIPNPSFGFSIPSAISTGTWGQESRAKRPGSLGSIVSDDTSYPNPSFGSIPSGISTRPRVPQSRPISGTSSFRLDAEGAEDSDFVPGLGAGMSVSQRPHPQPGKAPTQRRRSTLISFKGSFSQGPVVVLPAEAIEAATERVSAFYRGAIFDDGVEEEVLDEEGVDEDMDEEEDARKGDQTTMYTWPPTPLDGRDTTTGPSFLHTTHGPSTTSGGGGLNTTTFETQDFETQDQTYNTTSDCSIAQFPNFHFSLHSLTSLASLSAALPMDPHANKRKHSLLLAILEVDGPTIITLRKGPDAGKEVALLTMVLGDEDGKLCKLTAWREVAEDWGEGDLGVRRGDVIYIENVTAALSTASAGGPPQLTASPSLKSKLQICYRTMPSGREDMRLRPDLRLGESDAAVRKVGRVVGWFERMAGLG